MAADHLKVDKSLRPTWVHPEGLMVGSIFVKREAANCSGEEASDVLNQDSPFLVLLKQEPEEIRFYNRAAIVCAEYPVTDSDSVISSHTYECQLMMRMVQ